MVVAVSVLVLTVKLVFVSDAALGFVTPATVKVAAVFGPIEHVPPLLLRVTTSVPVPDVYAPAPEQLVKPPVSAIVGDAGMPVPNELSNTVVIV